ncbi:MAG: tRNA dihydrouridine synthase [Patescibacteria group bacterium]
MNFRPNSIVLKLLVAAEKPGYNSRVIESNFWQTLTRPIVGLSPMDGVSDQPFRHIHCKYGGPDVVYTEFTNVEGVCHGATKLLRDFLYDESQRPIIAQIYGITPSYFYQVAVVLAELGFDGVDINMGCPAKNVANSGAGAALIKNPALAREIIKQTKAGLHDWSNGLELEGCPDISAKIITEVRLRQQLLPKHRLTRRLLPLSVKTRLGYNESSVESWIPQLLDTGIEALAVHGRTLSQGYSGLADWSEIGHVGQLAEGSGVKIIGNGDVESRQDAEYKTSLYGLDGALIGRASLGNPLVFTDHYDQLSQDSSAIWPILKKIALEHARLYEKTYQGEPLYAFMPMRKHLGWYVRGVEGAKQLRIALFKANSSQDVEEILYGSMVE